MTVQSDGLAQVTLESTRAFWGDVTGDQVAPPSDVVTTTPLPGNDAPFEPTAMQSVGVGHEMPLSWGVLPPATRWAFHETPPLSRGGDHRDTGGRGGVGPGDAHGPTALRGGTGDGAEVARAARGRLADRQRVPLGLTEDARHLGRSRVPGQRTARRGDGQGSEKEGQAATASPDTPVSRHGAWKHGTVTIAVGGAFPGAPFATLAAVDWVDLLIIGLMLLAAVHGLRLGAVVQILTFGGFFLGFLLGTVVWVPLLSRGHSEDVTRSVVVVSLVLLTACAFGYAGRVLGTWSNVTVRRHHLGHVDAVLGVAVAVLMVLLSVWVVAAVILSPNSRFTSLDARRSPARTSSTPSTGCCPRPPPSSTTCRPS